MTSKLTKTTEVLLPRLLRLIFVRFIYLRWVQFGLCRESSACGTLRIGDCAGWTIVRKSFLCLDTYDGMRCCRSPQTGHTTLSSTPYRQLENQAPNTTGSIHLYNTLELQMMGIMVPETCWASNKICNKNHLLHLVGILFPHINDDARSKSLRTLVDVTLVMRQDVSTTHVYLRASDTKHMKGDLYNFNYV